MWVGFLQKLNPIHDLPVLVITVQPLTTERRKLDLLSVLSEPTFMQTNTPSHLTKNALILIHLLQLRQRDGVPTAGRIAEDLGLRVLEVGEAVSDLTHRGLLSNGFNFTMLGLTAASALLANTSAVRNAA